MSPLATALLRTLRLRRNARNVEGMRRFGITSRHEQLGIGMTDLRALARPHRRQHTLALELWDSGVMEAMILAVLVDDPAAVTRAQMNRWVRNCDCWALTDAAAALFDRTPHAIPLAHAWSRRRAEFTKRTGFVLMAGLAVHRKELPDAVFLAFLPDIVREATDERNFVRKAVNWALRQMGKRNPRLHAHAVACAQRLAESPSRSARWIGRDALRELRLRRPPESAARPKKSPARSRA